MRYPTRSYLITFSTICDRFDRKYVFYNGRKIIYSLEIDFSEIGPIKHDFDIIENIKKEYIAKYKPEFERMLEQIKVQIEQDNVKKLLDNI